jgi:hypothetical protein
LSAAGAAASNRDATGNAFELESISENVARLVLVFADEKSMFTVPGIFA